MTFPSGEKVLSSTLNMANLDKHHKDPENCPTCLWLSTHDAYETKFLCGEECADCLQIHLDLPFDLLKFLEALKGEVAEIIDLNIREWNEYNEDCLDSYIRKYLFHLLRDGDCLRVHSYRNHAHGGDEIDDVIFIRYKDYLEPLKKDLPSWIDITDFGRADYFFKILLEGTHYSTLVWSKFPGYERERILASETLDYAVWKMYKNFREEKAILDRKILPELAELIIAYLQDKWYVFSSFAETVPEEPTAYRCCDRIQLGEMILPDGELIQGKYVLHARGKFR